MRNVLNKISAHTTGKHRKTAVCSRRLGFRWYGVILRFATGIPRVGICHTVTVPSDTAPVQGKGRNRTLIYAVSYETRGIMNTHGYIVMQTTKTLLMSMPHVYYSIISISDNSLFLFEFPFTAARTSSNKMRSFRPQEPRQRKARMDEAESRLRVNERS